MANTIKINLKHPQPPDCCADCPLIGIIPKEYRRKGVRQSYCCLGVYPHEPLTSKGITVKASDKRERTGHIWHRVCDDRWAVWWESSDHTLSISKDSYKLCRLPYENRHQLAFNFK